MSGAAPWRTALVTGASSGIGEELTRQLAARPVGRLVLVARREVRLVALADELTQRHGTVCEVLPADLADRASLRRVEERLRDDDAPVDLLVNNAGFGSAGHFVDVDIDKLDEQVQVNVTALMRLTWAALPGMVARGRGAVMNISSLASYQPGPGNAVYAAGKSFVTSLSESVYEELRGTGVTVTAVCPGFTRTEFQSKVEGNAFNDAPGFVWMTAASVAEDAIEATARGRAVCVPGVGYRVVAAASSSLPRSARRWLVGRAAGKATRLARRLDR